MGAPRHRPSRARKSDLNPKILATTLRLLRILGEHTGELERLRTELNKTTLAIIRQWEKAEHDLNQLGWEASGDQVAKLTALVEAVHAIEFSGELEVLPEKRRRTGKHRPPEPAKTAAVGIAHAHGLTPTQIRTVLSDAGYQMGETTQDAVKGQLKKARLQGWQAPQERPPRRRPARKG